MKIAGKDCGCDARREIMFTVGNGHMVIGAVAVAVVVLTYLSLKGGSK